MRIGIYRTGPGESVLSLAVHHILADLWSMNLLVDELRSLYARLIEGSVDRTYPLRRPDMPTTSVGSATGSTVAKAPCPGISGKRALADAPPSLDLPTDRPRPKVQTYRGSAVSCPFDAEQFARLRDLAAREKTTLFVVLLSAFLVLLRRYTGRTIS